VPKKSPFWIGAAVLLAEPFAPSLAAEPIPVPDIDVTELCTRASRLSESDAPTEKRMLSCIGEEQRAYNALKPKWAIATKEAQQACLAWVPIGYQYVKLCIEQVSAAAGAKSAGL
jgi:hypothetical protein